MTVKGLIKARGGSKRVPNKNLKPFSGTSLLEIKIRQLQRMEFLDSVVVNSDSDEILEVARSLGAETVRRDPKFATDDVLPNDLFVNLAENIDCEYIVHADVTSPFLRDETIRDMFYLYSEKWFQSLNKALLTGTCLKRFIWKSDDDSNLHAVNFNPNEQPNSQALDNRFYIMNSACAILARDLMIRQRGLSGYSPAVYGIDEIEAIDIDTSIEFEFAEWLYNRTFARGTIRTDFT